MERGPGRSAIRDQEIFCVFDKELFDPGDLFGMALNLVYEMAHQIIDDGWIGGRKNLGTAIGTGVVTTVEVVDGIVVEVGIIKEIGVGVRVVVGEGIKEVTFTGLAQKGLANQPIKWQTSA